MDIKLANTNYAIRNFRYLKRCLENIKKFAKIKIGDLNG